MKRGLLALGAALTLSAGPGATQQPPQQAPTFRVGVELVQLDVAVLDKTRKPVTGLLKTDFTILENGKERPIVAYQEMSAPDPDGSLVPWMRDIAPDVRTNTADGRRVFVMVLDDITAAGGVTELQTVANVKTIARAFVERMGPLDQMCIVFTADNRPAQEFTSDRQALLAVIDKFHGTSVPGFLAHLYPSSVVGKAAQSLIEISHRRKAMIYVGTGFKVSYGPDGGIAQFGTFQGDAASDSQRIAEAQNAILQAQRANVSIYTINPRGLEAFTDEAARVESNDINDALWSVANETGGFSISNTNSFTKQVGQIFSETGSYYLLGFESAYADGKFRRVEVKVDRPGVNVRARSGYVATKPEKAGKEAAPVFKALAGALPNPDMYMRSAAAAFAIPEKPGGIDRKAGGVAIVLGLAQPGQRERATQVIDLISTAFTREGKPVTNRRQTARLTLRASEADARYEILSRLDLKPGHYNLRFAMHNTTLGKSGSVYADVEVPDFDKARLSMSGLAVSVKDGLPAAGQEILAGLIPFVPTTQRTFAKSDTVSVFARAYQDRGKPPVAATVTIEIRDSTDRVVHQATNALPAGAEADVSFALPTGTLVPGAYLLEVTASTGPKTTVRRDLRFNIR